jgi:hypothetical protein
MLLRLIGSTSTKKFESTKERIVELETNMPNLSASVSKQKFNELAKMVHAIEPQDSEPEESIKDQDKE